VLTIGGFVRYLLLFVIDLKTRGVYIADVTCRADGQRMAQVARHLTDAVAGPLRGFSHMIVDRDPLYTAQFESLLASAGVQVVQLPARSPNLNAFAERFVRSIRQECLPHIIPWASVTCERSSPSLSPTTMPSAIIRASATSSLSRPQLRRPSMATSAAANGSAGC
jgi:transposase InsO family protein